VVARVALPHPQPLSQEGGGRSEVRRRMVKRYEIVVLGVEKLI
jgi:hypothetical protein